MMTSLSTDEDYVAAWLHKLFNESLVYNILFNK